MKTGSFPEIYEQFWAEFATRVRRPDSGLSELALTVENSRGARCYVSKFKMEQKLEAWWCISKKAMRVQVVLMDSGAERLFDRLQQRKEHIESEYGQPLVWVDPRKNPKKAKNEGKTYFIQTDNCNCEPLKEELWIQQQRWLMTTLRRFYDTFATVDRMPDLRLNQS